MIDKLKHSFFTNTLKILLMKVQKSLNTIGKKLSREQLLTQLKMKNIKGGGSNCPPPHVGGR